MRTSPVKYLATLILAITFCKGYCQSPVTISGTAPFAAGEELRLLIFDDLINGTPTLAATDIIDKNGRFTLKYKTNEVKAAQLAIRTSKADLFIAPSVNYNFSISVDSVLFNKINPEKYGGMLMIVNNNPDTADLNYKINRFLRFYDSVNDEYSFRMIYDNRADAFDSVRTNIFANFPCEYNPENFYLSYIYYSMGNIDMLQYRKKPLSIYEKYFNNDQILYNNPAYMSLFNQYYSGYLYLSPKIKKDLLTEAINENPDYIKLFNEVGKDPKLTNARLRELVIIKNLIEFLDNKEFDRNNIIKLLEYIKQTSSFEKHIKIIENTLENINSSEEIASNVTFRDEKNKKVNLKHYLGKPVYLHIFQTDCIDCIREMAIISELNSKYGEKVQFVSLCIDPEESDYQNFIKKYKKDFDWPILYFNKEYDWIMREGIEALPDYIYYNADGTVANRFVASPEHGLPEFLMMTFPIEENKDDNPLFQERK